MSRPTELILPEEREERARPYNPPVLTDNGTDKIMQIVERMLREPTFDLDRVEKMLALKAQWEAAEAKKAYMVAMADFKKDLPVFFKTKHADYGAGKPKFDYAPIEEVTAKLVPAMAMFGLTHNWIPTANADGKITVKCVVTHRLGHSESIDSPPVAPNNNPAMSPSQNMQATITFWQRRTLESITGTAASNLPDIDESQASGEEGFIDEKQIANIEALLTEVNSHMDSFLRVIKVDSLSHIRSGAYDTVIALLEAKRKAK